MQLSYIQQFNFLKRCSFCVQAGKKQRNSPAGMEKINTFLPNCYVQKQLFNCCSHYCYVVLGCFNNILTMQDFVNLYGGSGQKVPGNKVLGHVFILLNGGPTE